MFRKRLEGCVTAFNRMGVDYMLLILSFFDSIELLRVLLFQLRDCLLCVSWFYPFGVLSERNAFCCSF